MTTNDSWKGVLKMSGCLLMTFQLLINVRQVKMIETCLPAIHLTTQSLILFVYF